MRVIEIPYPEALAAVLHMSPAAFEHEAKMALAVKLFELGRLTSGQAAQLAGVSRVTFLLECHRFGVLLVEAKWHGMLENVAAALQAMREYGYWMDDAIVQYALREASEAE